MNVVALRSWFASVVTLKRRKSGRDTNVAALISLLANSVAQRRRKA